MTNFYPTIESTKHAATFSSSPLAPPLPETSALTSPTLNPTLNPMMLNSFTPHGLTGLPLLANYNNLALSAYMRLFYQQNLLANSVRTFGGLANSYQNLDIKSQKVRHYQLKIFAKFFYPKTEFLILEHHPKNF